MLTPPETFPLLQPVVKETCLQGTAPPCKARFMKASWALGSLHLQVLAHLRRMGEERGRTGESFCV